MRALLKDNKPMVATIISGLLIVFGIILNVNQYQTAAAVTFVTSFLIGGWHQAVEGVKDTIENKRLNVDILMVLAAVGASLIGYWMEGALLIFIFSLSGSLEVMATNKSTKAITDLMHLTPDKAQRIRPDGTLEEVETDSLEVGNTVLVPKGTNIPIDGVLLKGHALINESAITGESMPVEKDAGEEVIGGTLNLEAPLTIQVSQDPSDTLFAKIVQMVEEAQSTPSKTATMIERIENKYVTAVLIFVPVMIAVFYFLLDWSWTESFYRGMVLLTVASPCALVASATPATLSAISNAARKGILFKGGAYMENISQISAIAFDKTGTLTRGQPVVTDQLMKPGTDEKEVIEAVVALEKATSHPLGQALVEAYRSKADFSIEAEALEDVTGKGIEGTLFNSRWKIGKRDYAVSDETDPFLEKAESVQKEGKTVTYVSRDDEVVAYFGLMDMPKPGAKETIEYFQSKDIHTILITGDNEQTARAIGQMVGVDEVRANCLPNEKAELVKELEQTYPMIAMVGDGINDAPALANASIGVAMGAGTDIAMDVADVVLMQDDLTQLPYSHDLSERLKRITTQNIVFSISVIVLLILSNLFQMINLPLAVIGHEGSTILVILNGLRLLRGRKQSFKTPPKSSTQSAPSQEELAVK